MSPPPSRRIWPMDLVTRVAELAAEGRYDYEIADEVGLTTAQVAGIRARHQIPAGRPRGRRPARPKPMEIPPDATANARWCLMLAEANATTWHAMRRAVCKVLKISAHVIDETMIAAAQQDPRTADELASAYLLALEVKPC